MLLHGWDLQSCDRKHNVHIKILVNQTAIFFEAFKYSQPTAYSVRHEFLKIWLKDMLHMNIANKKLEKQTMITE